MILKNKLFIVLFSILLFILTFSTNVKATNVNYSSFESAVGNDYYLMYKCDERICVVFAPVRFYLDIRSVDGSSYITAIDSSGFNESYGYFDSNGDFHLWQDKAKYLYLFKGSSLSNDNYLYSNFSIDGVFDNNPFPVPPLLTPLQQVMTEETENKTIQQTIIGLVVLLIPLLICLLGFWKAWGLLSRILHKA